MGGARINTGNRRINPGVQVVNSNRSETPGDRPALTHLAGNRTESYWRGQLLAPPWRLLPWRPWLLGVHFPPPPPLPSLPEIVRNRTGADSCSLPLGVSSLGV